jgi:hypothetical protein
LGKALKMERQAPETVLYSVEWCADRLERIIGEHLATAKMKASAQS